MAFYPKLTLTTLAIANDAPFSVYGREEVATEDQVHIRLVNNQNILANLRCTPTEALTYAQKIIDAANSFAEKEHDD